MAGIYGFSIFGSDHTYLLDKNKKIDYSVLNSFLKKFSNKKFLIFGFTSLVYKFLIENIDQGKISNSFHNAILIHGGGWKKILIRKLIILNSKNY